MTDVLSAQNGIARKFHLGAEEIASFKTQLISGIITHLRSVPIGLRVSDNLTVEFPELIDFESQHVEKELEIAKQSLSGSIKQTIPIEIYNATESINAAYAMYWGDRLESPDIVRPFETGNYTEHGHELLKIYNAVPSDATHDYELVDRWADYLGIRSWYTWTPYQAP